jgi:uncharacterized membrane-anchored protein
MRDNNSLNWPKGLKYVQVQKNNSFHSTIGCTPYFATFGMEMKFGAEGLVPRNMAHRTQINEDELKLV